VTDRMDLRACRRLVGDSPLTDEQVLALRDFLFTLAGVVTDAYSDLDVSDLDAFPTRNYEDLNPGWAE
jgi:hypothetical protein